MKAQSEEKKWFWARLQPQAVFLVLAVAFGFAVLVANPPFQGPDENDHFYRAFQLSDGAIIGQKQDGNAGGNLPMVVFRSTELGDIAFHPEKKMTRELFRKKWERPFVENWSIEPRVFVGFPHTVYYPPSGYIPQTAAIFLGRLFRLGPLVLMYLARLAALATAIWLGYLALRAAPIFRWSCLVLLLAPMSLYLMGSVAPDGLLVGSAFLLVSLLMRIGAGAVPEVDWRIQALILGLAGLIAASKVVYLPLVLLVPLFVMPGLTSVRKKLIFGFAFVVVCVIPVLAWSRLVAGLYVPGRTDIPIDPVAQGHFVAEHPFVFASVMIRSLWNQSDGIYRWFVGTLGWGDTPMPNWFYAIYGWGVFACLLAESSGAVVIRWRQRAFVLGAAASTVVLICGAQYAIWNSPGALGPIESLQGRYFLLVAPFVALCFPPIWRLKSPAFCAPLIGTALATTSAVVCLTAVILRYYFP